LPFLRTEPKVVGLNKDDLILRKSSDRALRIRLKTKSSRRRRVHEFVREEAAEEVELVKDVGATHTLRVGGAAGLDTRVENGAEEGLFDEKVDDL
jgi:hypothetical protein